MPRWTALLPLFAVAIGACASSSQQARDQTEEARLALEREANRLAVVWEEADPAERARMEGPLERMLEEGRSDPRVSELRLLLAAHYLEQRRRKDSDRIITPLLEGPEGPAKDYAKILKAEGLTLEGRGDEALDLLVPLTGKLVGEPVRVRHEKALVLAAIEARRWRLTIATMVDLLAGLGAGQEEALRFVDLSLERVPVLAQKRLLLEWTNTEFEGERKKASDAVGRLIVLRLTRAALETKDARLARDLYRQGPSWLRTSEYGEALSALAALAVVETGTLGKRVGLVLGGREPRETRRSIEVARGVTAGLEDSLELLTEDYRTLLPQALAALTGQGTAVLVSGFTPEAAAEARDFAELRKIPTILLSEPLTGPAPVELRYAFVLGSSALQEERALKTEMRRQGIHEIEVLGAGPSPCAGQSEVGGAFTFPWDLWQSRAAALIVLGDVFCAEELHRQAQNRKNPPLIALGLEASASAPTGVWSLRAGAYPSGPNAAAGAHSSWFEALGTDAARLVSVALQEVPNPNETEAGQMTYLERVRTALLDAQASLLTTKASGFGGKQTIERNLEVAR